MAQYSEPASEITIGNWTAVGTDSADATDCNGSPPTPDDTEYVTIDGADGGGFFEVKLASITDPGVDTGFIVHLRERVLSGSGGPERLDADLYEGATLRANIWSNIGLTDNTFTTDPVALDPLQVANITAFDDLRVRITVVALASGEDAQISMILLEAPDAGGASFDRTIIDSIGVSTSVSKVVTFERLVTNAIGISDQVLRSGTFERLVTDNIGISDLVSRAGTFERTVTDNIGISDLVSVGSVFATTITDNIGISDNVTITSTTVINCTLGTIDILGHRPSVMLGDDITFDSASGGTEQGELSVTFSHTCTGDNRILLVGVVYAVPATTIDSVTYGGDALTLIAGNASALNRTALYYRIAPSTGANDVVITLSGIVGDLVGVAVSYTNVKQTSPIGDSDTQQGLATTPSLTLTSAVGELVVDVAGGIYSSGGFGFGATANDPQVERVQKTFDVSWRAAMSDEPGAASSTVGWVEEFTSLAYVAAAIKKAEGSNNITITDSIGISDQVSRAGTFERTVTDSIGISTDVTVSLSGGGSTFTKTITDNIGVSDPLISPLEIAIVFGRSAADSIGISDLVSRAGTSERTITDSIGVSTPSLSKESIGIKELSFDATSVGISDTASASVPTNVVSTSDNVGVSDLVAEAIIFARTITDSIGISDLVTRAGTFERVITDNIGISDDTTAFVAGSNNVTATDSIGVSDLVSRAGTFERTITDNIGISDLVSIGSVFEVEITDNIGISDPLISPLEIDIVFGRSAADSIGISDSVFRAGTFERTITDNIGISDLVSIGSVFAVVITNSIGISDNAATFVAGSGNVTITDNIGISDSVTRAGTFERVITDNIGISDLVSRAGTSKRTVTDSIGISDLVSVEIIFAITITDNIGISDNVSTFTAGGDNVTTSDSIGISDLVSRAGTFERVITNSIGISDNVSTSQAGSDSVTTSDSIGISDLVSRAGTFERTVTDNIGISDQTSAGSVFSRTITDNIGISDNVSKAGTSERTITDSIGISDNVIEATIFVRAITDNIGISDAISLNLNGTFSRTIIDNLALSDSLTVVRVQPSDSTIYTRGSPSEISVDPSSPATIVVPPRSKRVIQINKPRM